MILQRTETRSKALATRMNFGIVFWCEGKADEAIAHYENLLPEFEADGDPLLLAKLHNNLGLAHRQKGDLGKTISEYELVKKYLNERDDLPAIAVVETNIAFALMTLRRYAEAHSHLNIAEEILTDFNDEILLGQCLETRARVYFAEGKIEQARVAIRHAKKLLTNGKDIEAEPLREALRTESLIEGQQ
jgi:tetratricopeptide (TPR) repeat protein